MEIPLPAHAWLIDHDTGTRERCVIFQAEQADGIIYFGGWSIDKKNQVVGYDSDFEILGDMTEKSEQTDGANPRPCGTSVMLPADPASRAGSTPEASGDSSSETLDQHMKHLIPLALSIATLAHVRAEDTPGTLTLEQEKVVFRTKAGEQSFDAMSVPGLKMIGFTQKKIVTGEKEAYASEMIFELPSGQRITLITAKPLEVVRTSEGENTTWSVQRK